MNQEEYWDKAADTKTFTTPFHSEMFSKYVKKDAYILDIGCGYGRTLKELYDLDFRNLHGLDFSEKMIKRGLKEFDYLDLKKMNGKNIDMPDDSVDSVILFAVLTCITNNQEQEYLIKEIRRVLKPGGIVYVNDFLLNQDERNISRYKKYENKYGVYGCFELPEGASLRHHDKQWIQKLFCDFEIIEMNDISFTTMNGNKSNGFIMMGRNK